MNEIIGAALMFIGMILIMLCNGIWYQCKFVLKRKGFPVNYFYNHFRDFRMIDKAVSEETDIEEIKRLRIIKKRMRFIRIIFPMAFILFFTGGFLGNYFDP